MKIRTGVRSGGKGFVADQGGIGSMLKKGAGAKTTR